MWITHAAQREEYLETGEIRYNGVPSLRHLSATLVVKSQCREVLRSKGKMQFGKRERNHKEGTIGMFLARCPDMSSGNGDILLAWLCWGFVDIVFAGPVTMRMRSDQEKGSRVAIKYIREQSYVMCRLSTPGLEGSCFCMPLWPLGIYKDSPPKCIASPGKYFPSLVFNGGHARTMSDCLQRIQHVPYIRFFLRQAGHGRGWLFQDFELLAAAQKPMRTPLTIAIKQQRFEAFVKSHLVMVDSSYRLNEEDRLKRQNNNNNKSPFCP